MTEREENDSPTGQAMPWWSGELWGIQCI